MSRAAARVTFPAESTASEDISSDEEVPGQSNMWCPLLDAAYHHSIGGFFGDECVPQQQGSPVTVLPLRALREPGGALVHRPVLHVTRRAP